MGSVKTGIGSRDFATEDIIIECCLNLSAGLEPTNSFQKLPLPWVAPFCSFFNRAFEKSRLLTPNAQDGT